MKLRLCVLLIYYCTICRADISLVQSLKNQFEGYDYPKPKISFPLPIKTQDTDAFKKTTTKFTNTLPSSYLPPTIPSTYLPPTETTTTKTIPRTTTTVKPTERIFVEEENEGYDYPKPKVAFPLPTPKVTVKQVESPPSTYLPPDTTRATTTTKKTTTTTKKPTTTKATTRATTTVKPTERIFVEEENEGYDYPKPKVAFPLPTPKVTVKPVESPPSTYLPPERITTTTRAPIKIVKQQSEEGYIYEKPSIPFIY